MVLQGIRYTDTDVVVDEVEEAVTQEMEGPGRLLGYRAMQKKLRKVHDLGADFIHNKTTWRTGKGNRGALLRTR